MIDQKWLETCAAAGEFLYGFYPVSVLKKMYETRKGCTILEHDLIEAVKQSDSILMDYLDGRLVDFGNYGDGFFVPTELEGTEFEPVMIQAQKDGNPYASLHIDDDARVDLLNEQMDVEFYIPTEKEITELVEEGFIRTPAMTELEKMIRSKGGNPEYLKEIWRQFSTDALDHFEAVNTIISGVLSTEVVEEGEGITAEMMSSVPTMDDLNALVPLVSKFLNNINLRTRRGWRSDALFKKTHPNGMTEMPTIMPGSVHAAKSMKSAEEQLRAMGVNLDFSSIDNFITVGQFGERRVIKVGRNDPCPCGSGKKYKKCHGR